LASLWKLPCLYVIENNHWGIGTAIERAVCVPRLAEDRASAYGIKGYTIDGMDFFACYAGFQKLYQEVLEHGAPVLVEVVTERFRGHSISDPGLYRAKDQLNKLMKRDPLILIKEQLMKAGIIDDDSYKALDKEQRQIIMDAMKFAEESPWPDAVVLEEGVYAGQYP